MATAPLPKPEEETVKPVPIVQPNPRNTASPLLFVMLGFLIAFPWIAQLLPQQVRDYIGLLFR
jgi:hypothetical protein